MLNRITRLKFSKEVEDFNNILNQLDIYKTLHTLPTSAEYTFFSSVPGTLFRINHMLVLKINLRNFFKD